MRFWREHPELLDEVDDPTEYLRELVDESLQDSVVREARYEQED